MGFVDFIKFLLPTMTLLSGAFLIIVLAVFLLNKLFGARVGFLRQYWGAIKKHALALAFIVALTATLGSLFYSEVAGYTPCKLCWFERIFMYSQVVLLGVALWKGDRKVFQYAIPFSIVGGLLAAYQYVEQVLQTSITMCAVGPDAVPCTTTYTFHYGYITIPMMALTAFILIILLAHLLKKKR